MRFRQPRRKHLRHARLFRRNIKLQRLRVQRFGMLLLRRFRLRSRQGRNLRQLPFGLRRMPDANPDTNSYADTDSYADTGLRQQRH